MQRESVQPVEIQRMPPRHIAFEPNPECVSLESRRVVLREFGGAGGAGERDATYVGGCVYRERDSRDTSSERTSPNDRIPDTGEMKRRGECLRTCAATPPATRFKTKLHGEREREYSISSSFSSFASIHLHLIRNHSNVNGLIRRVGNRVVSHRANHCIIKRIASRCDSVYCLYTYVYDIFFFLFKNNLIRVVYIDWFSSKTHWRYTSCLSTFGLHAFSHGRENDLHNFPFLFTLNDSLDSSSLERRELCKFDFRASSVVSHCNIFSPLYASI